MCAMRGEFGSDDGKVDMGELMYRRWGEHGLAEVPPDTCPAGHPLKRPNVRVGWDGTGRTYTCETCWAAGTRPHTMRYLTAGAQGESTRP